MPHLRLAVRRLAKSPGFTTLALITLALGIGVNTSMLSVVQALIFRSAPYPDAQQLVQIVAGSHQGPVQTFSAIEQRELREQVTSLTSLTTLVVQGFVLTEPGTPGERVAGSLVSHEFFPTFGVRPMMGRAFTAEECQQGRNQVVLLSQSFWQSRFGGDPSVIGRTLRVDGDTVTVIGVMPGAFEYRMLWGGTDMWRPLNFTSEQLEWRDYRAFRLIGRLKAGETPESAGAQLEPLASRQQQEHPEIYGGLRYQMLPLHVALMDSLGRRVSWMLLGLSAFVLLIACANLANLQLARAISEARQFAIRSALGASRRMLIVQQLAESVILSLAGAGIGLGLAWVSNRFIERNYFVAGAPGVNVTIDLTVLSVTLLVAVGTGVLFGVVPAVIGSRTDVNSILKAQSRGSSTGRGHQRLRQALILGEVALAVVLLGGAGVLQRGFSKFLEKDSGWDTSGVITASLPVPSSRIATNALRVEFFRKLESRLTALPGVEHAAIATSLPIDGYNGARQILTDGQSPGDAARLPAAFHVMVTPDYFATIGIPLLKGRLFPADVNPRSPRVVIVNEALANQIWPGQDPIGKRLCSMDSGEPYWAEVIGVVRDVEAAASLGTPATHFHVYKPLVHEPWGYVNLVVRSPAPETLSEGLRRAVTEVDPELPPESVGTVRQIVRYQQTNLQLAAKLLTGFALLGLVLAGVGIFGVISHLVAQRRGEFAIRLALGAQPHDVLKLVFGYGMASVGLGLVAGLAGAWALSRLLWSLMPRLVLPDPLTLVGVASTLVLVALAACYFPARRATQTDPLEALRDE